MFEQDFSNFKVIPVDSCLEGCSSAFVAIIDVNSFFDQVLSSFYGSDGSFFLSEQFFDRIGVIGYILCLDEEVDSGEISNVDVDGVWLHELDEEVHFCVIEQAKGLLVVVSGVVIGIGVVFVGLD